ncbi:acetyltransferase [Castellaniella ginsengisoli]|uniref:Acetyltransferase n=1 Tax=Castellaniella ginsengisoli TaxID=546114 RepID=A0AB39DJV0_9BURK
MKLLAILGASGHGKVVAEIARAAGWDQVEFYDDAWPAKAQIGIWQIVGDTSALLMSSERFSGVVVAIGSNVIRLQKLQELQAAGLTLATIVHPAAIVSESASLGVGTVVMAGAVINADARIGLGAILNTGCGVDHDCVLGEAVHISPGAHLAGDVHVGDRSWIGIGASVRQGQRIGAGVMVGAGAAVVTDITDDVIAVGVPARVLTD